MFTSVLKTNRVRAGAAEGGPQLRAALPPRQRGQCRGAPVRGAAARGERRPGPQGVPGFLEMAVQLGDCASVSALLSARADVDRARPKAQEGAPRC
eukprot:scaffold14064_cov29-Tisochrysis_lutea.AAC.2